MRVKGNRRFLEPAPRTFYLPLSASARQIPECYSRYGWSRRSASRRGLIIHDTSRSNTTPVTMNATLIGRARRTNVTTTTRPICVSVLSERATMHHLRLLRFTTVVTVAVAPAQFPTLGGHRR